MALKEKNLSILQLFRYADGVDKLLILLGTIGSIGDGMMTPLTMVVLSSIINEYGPSDNAFSSSIVDKYSLRLLYVAVGVGGAAFMGKTSGYFDTQTGTSATYQVVSTISSDVNSIKMFLIPNFLAHLTSFSACLILAFVLSWRLAVAFLPFTLMFIILRGAKMKSAYGVAGGIAEQSGLIDSTVFSYVAELETLERFSHELQESMELGIKQGVTKGLMIGSMGMIFATWAFLSWVGSVLMMNHLPNIDSEEESGKKLTSMECSKSRASSLSLTSIKENILFGKEGAPMELLFNLLNFNCYSPTATSALDAESERSVQDALDKASTGRTTIIIAHRLSTIRRSDLILVLQSGKVIESGTHDELTQMNNRQGGGTYSKMVELQHKALQNDSLNPNIQTERKHQTKTRSFPSPISMRSSGQNCPSPYFSPSPAYSFIQTTYNDDPYEKDGNLVSSYPPTPSQWRLLVMNAPEWKRAVLGCLGAIGFGAVQTTHAFSLGSVVSVYYLTDDNLIRSKTNLYCFIFLGLTVLSFVTNLLQHYNFAVMGERLTKRIGWFDQDENTSAAICARLATEANMVRSLVGDRVALLLQVFTGASLACVLALAVAWRLAAVMIAMQPFLICCFYSRSVLMKRMSEKARIAQNEGSQLASEAVVNHRTITAFSSQNRILSLFETTRQVLTRRVSQFLTTASIALSFWYGGRLIHQNVITSQHMFQAFFVLMSTGKNIADAGSMTSDLAKGIKPKMELEGNIVLKNVFFAYPARPDQMIFKGLTLKIEAGTTVALVGESGSGKSTIISLIERFYDPLNGSVEIDKKDIKLYNLRALRSHIALVSQEPTLFAGTIRENIVYGKQLNVAEAELRQAALLANAHGFISSMENGYETYCGERGVQLSGGQKQRIALARAILKNPAIDEATSALDSVSENLVQQALEKMMIESRHHISYKNGKVAEQGSHSRILEIRHGGSYYSLIRLQGSNSPYR
ncbi:hypothetical protein MKW92_025713 [Papaver armeniacum]|nr:hypothetical protein MKW92_025713 [Papaver armeniacum]